MLRPLVCILLSLAPPVMARPPAGPPAEDATPPVAAPAPAPAADGTLAACAAKAYDDYASAMSGWEQQRADGMAAAQPGLADAAHALATAHIDALQRDGYRIHYFAANRPAGLNLQESVAALRLFNWTADDERALQQAEPGYAAVVDAAQHAQEQADHQPRRDELENYLEESPAANAAQLHPTNDALQRGNAALAACRKPAPADTTAPAKQP